MKQVQISYDLFLKLIKFHVGECFEFQEEIEEKLENKLDKIINRNLYTKYKTAPTVEEKEEARQKYLDIKGYREEFRW